MGGKKSIFSVQNKDSQVLMLESHCGLHQCDFFSLPMSSKEILTTSTQWLKFNKISNFSCFLKGIAKCNWHF